LVWYIKEEAQMSQIVKNLLINGQNPVTVGGTGTTTKFFPAVPGSGIGVTSTKNGFLFVPDNNEANAQRLNVTASGNFTIGSGATTSPAVTIGLYPVTFTGSAQINSNPSALGLTSTASIGATPILSATFAGASDLTGFYPWALTCDLQGDSSSGLVQLLSGSIVIDGTGTASTIGLVSGLSGINFATVAPYGVVVGVTFSVSDPGALANMYQFIMSL
jgi:hypothetical protein